MPIQVDGAFVRAPCPIPSCPACEPNFGSVPPSLSTKATRVERGRHCYAIKWVVVRTCPVIRLIRTEPPAADNLVTRVSSPPRASFLQIRLPVQHHSEGHIILPFWH